eukprot:GHVQ01029616.1.p1 GENE.GHVQ01029616.1~~GHVQ01029616.1.p1  ORF type:complete len:442 (-),score=50.46 GHVQ01029616.1:1624-2949(-)
MRRCGRFILPVFGLVVELCIGFCVAAHESSSLNVPGQSRRLLHDKWSQVYPGTEWAKEKRDGLIHLYEDAVREAKDPSSGRFMFQDIHFLGFGHVSNVFQYEQGQDEGTLLMQYVRRDTGAFVKCRVKADTVDKTERRVVKVVQGEQQIALLKRQFEIMRLLRPMNDGQPMPRGQQSIAMAYRFHTMEKEGKQLGLLEMEDCGSQKMEAWWMRNVRGKKVVIGEYLKDEENNPKGFDYVEFQTNVDDIISQVYYAVEYMASKGVMHRNLNFNNIYIQDVKGVGDRLPKPVVKIAGFSHALAESSEPQQIYEIRSQPEINDIAADQEILVTMSSVKTIDVFNYATHLKSSDFVSVMAFVIAIFSPTDEDARDFFQSDDPAKRIHEKTKSIVSWMTTPTYTGYQKTDLARFNDFYEMSKQLSSKSEVAWVIDRSAQTEFDLRA